MIIVLKHFIYNHLTEVKLITLYAFGVSFIKFLVREFYASDLPVPIRNPNPLSLSTPAKCYTRVTMTQTLCGVRIYNTLKTTSILSDNNAHGTSKVPVKTTILFVIVLGSPPVIVSHAITVKFLNYF